jgi:hypothetical protein
MCIEEQIVNKIQKYKLYSYFLVVSGIFGVAVAVFLVTLCPVALCNRHKDGQLTAILRPIPGTGGVFQPLQL